MDPFRQLRSRQSDLRLAIANAAVPPPTVAGVYLGRAIAPLPPSLPGIVMTVPVTAIDADETAGASVDLTVDADAGPIPVVVLGSMPAVGDYLIARQVRGRWVARAGTGGEPVCTVPSEDLVLSLVWYDHVGGGVCRRRTAKLLMRFSEHPAPYTVPYTGDDPATIYSPPGFPPASYETPGFTAIDGRVWASDCATFPANPSTGYVWDEIAGVDLPAWRSVGDVGYPLVLPVAGWRFVLYRDLNPATGVVAPVFEAYSYNGTSCPTTGIPGVDPAGDIPIVPTRWWTQEATGPNYSGNPLALAAGSTVGPYGRRWRAGGRSWPWTWGEPFYFYGDCFGSGSTILIDFHGAGSWFPDAAPGGDYGGAVYQTGYTAEGGIAPYAGGLGGGGGGGGTSGVPPESRDRGNVAAILGSTCSVLSTNPQGTDVRHSRFFTDAIISVPDVDPFGPCVICLAVRCCADDCPESIDYAIFPVGGESETTYPPSRTGAPGASGSIPTGAVVCVEWPVSTTPLPSSEWFDVYADAPSGSGLVGSRRRIRIDEGTCLDRPIVTLDMVDSTYTPTFYVYGAKPTCPVEGARVDWVTDNGSFSDTTDADGLVSFPGIYTPPANTTGTLTITPPTGCGWEALTESFTLTPEYLCDPTRIDRQLQPASGYTYAGGVCVHPLLMVTTMTGSVIGLGGFVLELTYFGYDAGTSTALWTACGGSGTPYVPTTCGDGSKSYASSEFVDINAPVGYTLQITGSCDSGPPTWLITKQGWKTNATCTGDASKLIGRVWRLPVGTIEDITCSDGLVTAPSGVDSSTELAEAEASGTFDCSCGATTTGTLTAVGVGSPPDAFLGDVSFDL